MACKTLKVQYEEMWGTTAEFWRDDNVGDCFEEKELEKILQDYVGSGFNLKEIFEDKDLVPLKAQRVELNASDAFSVYLQALELGAFSGYKMTKKVRKELQAVLNKIEVKN